jgi:hypothetical protein
MIDVDTAYTPNGVKVPIALEELGVPWRVHRINLGANEQTRPEFLRLNIHLHCLVLDGVCASCCGDPHRSTVVGRAAAGHARRHRGRAGARGHRLR